MRAPLAALAMLIGLAPLAFVPGARAGLDPCFTGDLYSILEAGWSAPNDVDDTFTTTAEAEGGELRFTTSLAGPFAGADLDESGLGEDGFAVSFEGGVLGELQGVIALDRTLELRYDVDVTYTATDYPVELRGDPATERGAITQLGFVVSNVADLGSPRGSSAPFEVFPSVPTEGSFKVSGTADIGPLNEFWQPGEGVAMVFVLELEGMAQADSLSFQINELTLADALAPGPDDLITAEAGGVFGLDELADEVAETSFGGNEATYSAPTVGPFTGEQIRPGGPNGFSEELVLEGFGCTIEEIPEDAFVVVRYEVDVDYQPADWTPVVRGVEPEPRRGFIDRMRIRLDHDDAFDPYEIDLEPPSEGAFTLSGLIPIQLAETWEPGGYFVELELWIEDMSVADTLEVTFGEVTVLVPPRGAADALFAAASWADNRIYLLGEDLEVASSFPTDSNNAPNGLAIDGSTIYVANWFEDEVIAYNSLGIELFRWTSVYLDGVQAMEFIPPPADRGDSDPPEGYLAVFDSISGMINLVRPSDGTFIDSFPAADPFFIEGLAYDPLSGILFQLDTDVIHATALGGLVRGGSLFTIPNPAAGNDFGGTGLTYVGDDTLVVATTEGDWYAVSSDPSCYDLLGGGGPSCLLASGNNGIDMWALKFLAAPTGPACPGDINGDGVTNVFDFAVLADFFGAGPGATFEEGDLNGDGFVDIFDFAVFAEDFACGTEELR